MPSAPKVVAAKITNMKLAWAHMRRDKSFSGLNLEQFSGIVQPSLAVRDEITELEARLSAATARRETADETSMKAVQRVVRGVQGDPEEGEDGELYAAMGFVRKSQRSSGLTRKRKEEGEKGQEDVATKDGPVA